LDPIRLFPGRAASIHPPEEKNAKFQEDVFFNSGRPRGRGRAIWVAMKYWIFPQPEKEEGEKQHLVGCVDGAAQWKCKTIKIENDQKGRRKK
jgi:hypothetical protein